jgi:hypothetical protein
MIRVILQGRTGNNLFQYAAGRALALSRGEELVLDGAWADPWHAGHFKHLSRFPLAATYERTWSFTKRIRRRLLGHGPDTWYQGELLSDVSTATHVDLDFGLGTRDAVLLGFFQSPHYFSKIESILRKELDPTAIKLPPVSLRFEESLQASNTISLHVRRGDYVNISSTACIGLDYHDRAMDWFHQRQQNLRFCVFSDDIPWCRKRFQGPGFIFADLPAASGDPLHDLRLMASCKHHIIVNSSYSWWGAWMNASPTKIVVAPSQWMNGLPSEGIIPPEWIAL